MRAAAGGAAVVIFAAVGELVVVFVCRNTDTRAFL
jgi:hypothetical protein